MPTVPERRSDPWPSPPRPSRIRSSSPAAGSSRPDVLVVDNPADPTTPAGTTYNATEAQYEEAVEAAVAAFEVTRKLPAYERGRILREISAGLKARREELGRLIALEAGKPIRDALVEVDRAILTFRLGAEEAERMTGEVIPLDLMPSSKDRVGITRRFPIGPIAGISPFNFPLNLAAHKLAPAIASGNPIVLKPPSKDPLTMLTVAEIIEAAGVPAGSVSILPMTRELGDRMVADERFKLLTFTGSPSVGWRMKERAGKKKVVLELGGNAGRHRRQDRRPRLGGQALPRRRLRLRRPGLHQRPAHVHPRGRLGRRSSSRFVEGARALKVGDPLDPTTDLGPMVDATAAGRTQRWVDEAVAMGGKVLAGGRADGTFFPPTILTDVPLTAQVCSNEAFAPLVVAFPFHDLDEAIAAVNDSMFGLQTGVFTNDLAGAWRAFAELEVGGVIDQRHPDLPDRPHALRRGQGLRPRPRGPALRHRGHDRDPDHGARPARLRATRASRSVRFARAYPPGVAGRDGPARLTDTHAWTHRRRIRSFRPLGRSGTYAEREQVPPAPRQN